MAASYQRARQIGADRESLGRRVCHVVIAVDISGRLGIPIHLVPGSYLIIAVYFGNSDACIIVTSVLKLSTVNTRGSGV